MASGQVFMAPLGVNGGQEGGGLSVGGHGGGASGAGARSLGDGGAPLRAGQTPTVLSLSRLLEGLEHTLDSPLDAELFTPIDKRNSFCAQMVNIAQVLEDDPSMQGLEDPRNSHFSYLAQKRRSSVSELASYLHDMLEDGESSRMIANTPGWTLPPPLTQGSGNAFSSRENQGGGGNGNGGGGSGNRVTFKRSHPDNFGPYTDYGMDGRGGGSSESGGNGADSGSAAWTGSRSGGGQGEDGEDPQKANPKRARGTPAAPLSGSMGPPSAEGGGEDGGGGGHGRGGGGGGNMQRRGSRRMSEARMNAKVAASSTVVQALTCLASALPGISDSEDNMEDALDGSGGGGSGRGGAGGAGGGREGARELSPSALSCAGPQGGGGASGALSGGGGAGASAGCVVKTEASPHRGPGGGLDPAGVKREEGDSDTAALALASAAQHQPPMRRRSRAINDVVTNFSIDRALEQLKSDEGKDDDDADGEAAALTRKGNRQRASVYVLMHAIAAVDTANDEPWDGDEEPLEGVEEATSAI